MASEDPRTWGQRPYPPPLETEGEYRRLGLEGEGRSWGGGRGGAPWRPREGEERGGPQRPPSTEDRGSYGVLEDMRGRGRGWMPPREEEEEEDSWGATTRTPQEPPREYWSPKQEGRRGSWEPPRKRARSPPVGERRRIPLSPHRGRGSTSPDSQRQPSAPSRHATHREPSYRSARRDSPRKGGHQWVSRGRRDSRDKGCRERARESSVPAWESCRDPGTSQLANQRATEGRVSDRSRWLEEPGSSGGGGGSSSSSIISRHRSRGDPGWETRHGNPVDGSYSVKAGGSRERWSGRGLQGFRRQVDSRERDVRGPKGGQEEGWPRDEGRSVGSPRGSIPRKGRGAKESFRGGFLGPTGGPERCEGERRQAATSGTFFPRLEVVNYWARCQHIMLKNERDKFVSFCPRPYIADRSSVPPNVNPDMKWLIGKQARTLSTNVRVSLQTQWDVLTMLAPAMALYEMAEAAMDRQERVDPLAVRPLARSLLSFVGSANRGLTVQRCSQVLQAIDPRLTSMAPTKTSQDSNGLLFAENDMKILKEAIRRLPKMPEEPPERNFSHRWEGRKSTLIAPPAEFAPLFRDGSAPFPEMSSDQQVQLQDEASLDLWHRRFGHVDSGTILRLQSDNLATGIKVVDPGEADGTARCLTCLSEKGAKPSLSLHAVSRSTASMDLIHCELSGPFEVPSLKLQRYVLLFVDDYSRYCVTFLLKETTETHKYFKSYFAMLKKSHKLEPKAFQMNSAADSILPHTLTLLAARGIAHKRGVECLPGESRTAEREMKSLLGMTRCMLADANLPDPFWGHAILAATYLWNRLAVSPMKRTPFQAWSGKVPWVNHLRVFGSLVRNRENPNDFTQHVYVGYTFSLGQYTVMNLETGVVTSKGGLDFDERQGTEKRGDFLVTLERQGCEIEKLTDQDEASLDLWHRRFGHADSATILRLQSDNLATGIKVIDPGEADGTTRCLTCRTEKGTKPSLSLNAVSRSTASMDLIHCELSGPFDVPSLKLQRYVLLFVDDYSRYCVTFLLKVTTEMHEWFKKYLAGVRKSHMLEPKAFQMNSAADSLSPQTLDFLEGRDIAHKRAVECLPGESRTAKREMKSLLGMTRYMLADAKLPAPFWGHAILAATYLWNRLAVGPMKSTPFQAWSGKVPCVNHLRVFGSLVRNRENPNDPTQHVYVGYTFSVAKYTVMNLETGVVSSKGGLDFDERQGVEKRGNFLVTLERQGCTLRC